MAQYHDNNPDVAKNWDALRNSIDAYIQCAETCYSGGKSGCGCREGTKNQLRVNLINFQTAIARSRELFWKKNLCDTNTNTNALCQP